MTDTNLHCDGFEALLGEYLEGALDDSRAAAAELHLAACASCRSLADDLRAIAATAASLPPLAPSRDLWPAIEARIAPKVLPLAAPAPSRRSPWALGAIAAALVGATALTTWTVARRDVEPGGVVATTTPAPAPVALPAAPSPAPAAAPASPSTTPSVIPASSSRVRPEARETYTAEINRLQGVLDERADVLDPRTVAIIEASLATIDSAIAQARGALAKDPGSRFLNGQLNKSLEHKLGLLRTAALLSSTT